MQVIRQKPSLRRLPIIALTAKAMKAIGRSVSKLARPSICKAGQYDQLLSALRMWLHR